jgi:hypothetical protein
VGQKSLRANIEAAIDAALTESEPDNPVYRVQKAAVMRAATTSEPETYIIQRLDRLEALINTASPPGFPVDHGLPTTTYLVEVEFAPTISMNEIERFDLVIASKIQGFRSVITEKIRGKPSSGTYKVTGQIPHDFSKQLTALNGVIAVRTRLLPD